MGGIRSPFARTTSLAGYAAFSPGTGQPAMFIDDTGTPKIISLGAVARFLRHGEFIDWNWLTEDATYGYSVEEGATGVVIDGSGHMVLTADDTNPTVRVRLPILGAISGYRELALKVSAMGTTAHGWGGTQDTSTRCGLRAISSGGAAGAWAEVIIHRHSSSVFRGACHTTDGSSDSYTNIGNVTIGGLEMLTLAMNPDSGGAATYPSILAGLATSWDTLQPSTGGIWGTLTGIDLSTPTTELWEIYVDQGPGGDNMTVTIEGFRALANSAVA